MMASDNEEERAPILEQNGTPCCGGGNDDDVRGPSITRKLPWGAILLDKIGLFNWHTRKSLQLYVLVLTFMVYASYHMSRKPFSVVANVLAPNCSKMKHENFSFGNGSERPGWPPFNEPDCKTLIGAVDYAWLFTYAVFLVASGLIADRINLRYFLTIGMCGSGIFVSLLGVSYYGRIHHLWYFLVIQVFVGIFESTGWPGVISVMGNWFGKKRRGLLLGIWNAHTSVGNILGTAIPAFWAVEGGRWAWSFFVPGFVMIGMGMIVFLFLITDPTHLGLSPPKHHLEVEDEVHKQQTVSDSGPLTTSGKTYYSSIPNGAATDKKSGVINWLPSRSPPGAKDNKKAINPLRALMIPGVIEYSLALFFAKLVAYTFLFWLPYYIDQHKVDGKNLHDLHSDLIATVYDVGGIFGGIFTGAISDILDSRAISCVIMMYLAVPTLFLYRSLGHDSIGLSIFLIILCGFCINGPYALITTAVSNDLGTHKALKDNTKAKATVGAIIDGTGSLGAACGPLITGVISGHFGWNQAFYMLMASCFLSSLMLSRLLVTEIIYLYRKFRRWRSGPEDVSKTYVVN